MDHSYGGVGCPLQIHELAGCHVLPWDRVKQTWKGACIPKEAGMQECAHGVSDVCCEVRRY